MKKGPVNSYSLKWSIVLHAILLGAALVLPLLSVFRKKELVIPVDFTVVLEENLVEPNVPPTPDEPEPEPAAEPEPEPEPPKPAPLPDPPKNVVALEKKKEPEKKPPPEKKKPEEKKPKPFKKGRRVEAKKPLPKPKEDFTKLKPVTSQPVTDKKLSRAEIDKALRDGAKQGSRNVIPEDELSRCVLLVRRALYEAWQQPNSGDAGSRPTLLTIRLDQTGRLVSYRIHQSSGSAYFDQTVLKAAASAAPIRGLTPAFLKLYETLIVEFKLE